MRQWRGLDTRAKEEDHMAKRTPTWTEIERLLGDHAHTVSIALDQYREARSRDLINSTGQYHLTTDPTMKNAWANAIRTDRAWLEDADAACILFRLQPMRPLPPPQLDPDDQPPE